jgi:signal transduction histidine kinase
LDKLVTDLMELAKLDDPAFRLAREPFVLPELLQDIFQKFRLTAEEKGVAVEIEGPAGGAPVYGDIGLIERVFDNLVDNALRATKPGDRITVSLEPGDGRLEIKVTDTGRGIDPEDLPRIFDRFYQPRGGGKEPGRAGLGLAITRKILELHGSPLEVSSTPGRGTSFSFHLSTTQA